MAKKRTTSRSKQTQQDNAGAQDRQGLGLDSILGAMMGGGEQQQMPSSAMGAQSGGLDMGSILGGLLGGGLGGGNMQGGMMGGAAGALLGPLVQSISEKTGLPPAIVMAGASFLLSKLMNGGLSGSVPTSSVGSAAQSLPAHADGGIDLGSILGGLLGGGMTQGGGNMPQMPTSSSMPAQGSGIDLGSILGGLLGGGMTQGGGNLPTQAGGGDLGSILGSILGGSMPSQAQPDDAGYPDPQAQQQAPQQGGVEMPSGDKVLGKIGQSADNAAPQAMPQGGIRIQGLTAGNEHQFVRENGLANEFAQQTGLDEHTAAQSLSAILSAMQGG